MRQLFDRFEELCVRSALVDCSRERTLHDEVTDITSVLQNQRVYVKLDGRRVFGFVKVPTTFCACPPSTVTFPVFGS